MSSEPERKPRKRTPRKKSRRGARLAFFLIFLLLFGAADLLVLTYEYAARQEFEKAGDHIANERQDLAQQTYLRVVDEHPYSYVACRARRLVRALPPGRLARMRRGPENVCQIGLRLLSRRVVAPLLVRIAPARRAEAERITTARFDPLATSYVPLAAGLLAWLIAVYMLLGVWRRFKIDLGWRMWWFAATSGFAALEYLRAAGAAPGWLARLAVRQHYLELEFLAGLALALTLFCLLFAGGAPPEERRPAGPE